jgi:hypothetical protein
MAASKPPRKSDDVPHADLLDDDDPDAHLLDEEEPDTVVVHTTYDYTFAPTPKSTGKNLKINSPHPVDMPKTPPATPPRPGTSAEAGTSKDATGKVNVPSGRHYTKLGIYLHTDRRPSLTRILTTHFACNPRFFTNTKDLDSIVEKAKFLLMNQEPYHTLLHEGCSITFVKPQLSYKVVAIEENDLIDFVTTNGSLTPTFRLAVTSGYNGIEFRDEVAWEIAKALEFLWSSDSPLFRNDVGTLKTGFELTVDTTVYIAPYDLMVAVADLKTTSVDWLTLARQG